MMELKPDTGGLMKPLIELGGIAMQYLGFIIMAIMGGTARYLGQLNSKQKIFSLVEFIGELFISGFTGLIVALACEAYLVSWHWTVIAVAISGHMGGRLIAMIELAIAKFLRKRFPAFFN